LSLSISPFFGSLRFILKRQKKFDFRSLWSFSDSMWCVSRQPLLCKRCGFGSSTRHASHLRMTEAGPDQTSILSIKCAFSAQIRRVAW
jgi:hypothetical protein